MMRENDDYLTVDRVCIPITEPEFGRRMRELTGRIVYNEAIDMYVVTHYDDVAAVSLAPELYSSRRDIDKREHLAPAAERVLRNTPVSILVNDDPPLHTRLRAVASNALCPRSFGRLRESIVATVDELVSSVGDEVDVPVDLSGPLTLRTICEVMGIPPADASQIRDWSASWASLNHQRGAGERAQVVWAQDVVRWQKYTLAQIEQRQNSPQGDIVTMIVEAASKGEPPFNKDEIAVFIMGILFAGHETTRNLISNTIRQIVEQGEWAHIAAEPDLVPAAIEETLRLDPPVRGMIRRVVSRTELAGVRLEADDQLLLSYAAANRDPTKFERPDTYDLRRPRQRHIAFGLGIHHCLGAELARAEADCMIRALLAEKPTPPHISAVKGRISVVHNGPQSLVLTWGHPNG